MQSYPNFLSTNRRLSCLAFCPRPRAWNESTPHAESATGRQRAKPAQRSGDSAAIAAERRSRLPTSDHFIDTGRWQESHEDVLNADGGNSHWPTISSHSSMLLKHETIKRAKNAGDHGLDSRAGPSNWPSSGGCSKARTAPSCRSRSQASPGRPPRCRPTTAAAAPSVETSDR